MEARHETKNHYLRVKYGTKTAWSEKIREELRENLRQRVVNI
jgi:hypothetical protein